MHARFGFGGINALYGGMELTDSVRRNDVTRKSTYCLFNWINYRV